jgi:hypothetical protein
MYRKAAEERMRQLRGLTRLEEIARRIVESVDDVYQVVKNDVHSDVVMKHTTKTITLPRRLVTDEELANAKAECESLRTQEQQGRDTRRRRLWHEQTIERYEKQKDNPTYEMELHAVRLGDVAICTNPFELFTDYGIQIKARSQALQTFVIQLACSSGIYVPTEKAVRGGSYSAGINSNLVGPQGGQELVERTVEAINSLWND